MTNIDVLIPTYKPNRELCKIIEMLEKQTRPIHKIIIINTEESYWNDFIIQNNFKQEDHKLVWVEHIAREEFDHGKTRDVGMRQSIADIVICMTQDAIPADEYLVERLIENLKLPKVAVSYGRQLAKSDTNQTEAYTRKFNYPDQSKVKSIDDIKLLGIKTYFCSNVCAAYHRELYIELGGFVEKTIFNEDMIFGANVINSGWKIGYVADAKVYHAHNYNNRVQFQRNFDLGVSQADHSEIFEGIPVESEGFKLVKNTCKYLSSHKLKRYIIPMIVTSGYKFIGFKMGKSYKRFPKWLIKKASMNRSYWENQSISIE